jgi:hypothetical protein
VAYSPDNAISESTKERRNRIDVEVTLRSTHNDYYRIRNRNSQATSFKNPQLQPGKYGDCFNGNIPDWASSIARSIR